MAFIKKNIMNFVGISGSPTHATNWDELKWDFAARVLKIIVESGSTADLEISMDGKDVFGKLPAPLVNMNSLEYNFNGIDWSRIYVRKSGAKVQIFAYAPK